MEGSCKAGQEEMNLFNMAKLTLKKSILLWLVTALMFISVAMAAVVTISDTTRIQDFYISNYTGETASNYDVNPMVAENAVTPPNRYKWIFFKLNLSGYGTILDGNFSFYVPYIAYYSSDVALYNYSCQNWSETLTTWSNLANHCDALNEKMVSFSVSGLNYSVDNSYNTFSITRYAQKGDVLYIMLEDQDISSDSVRVTASEGANPPLVTLRYIPSGNITIRAYNNRTGAPLTTFNASINGTVYNSSGGVINTNISYRDAVANVTIDAPNYFPASFTDLTLDANISVYLEEMAVGILLIDERNGSFFDVRNVSIARIYNDLNSTYYDFKSTNLSYTDFSIENSSKLRLEIGWSDGTFITTYINSEFFEDENISLCANREGTPLYTQYLISSSQKQVWLKSIFADCYVAADYTRFAYDNYLILKAPTIQTYYELYVSDDGETVLLASLDGSVESNINIDNLLFLSQGYNILSGGDALSIGRITNSTGHIVPNVSIITYMNYKEDNTALTITITNQDNGAVVYNSSAFANLNNVTIIFDYTTLNVSNSTLFKITATATTPTRTRETSVYLSAYYYTTDELDSGVAIVLALMLVIFGLTAAASRTSLGWLGLLSCIGGMVILSFTIESTYVKYVMGILVITFIYIALQMKDTNPMVT